MKRQKNKLDKRERIFKAARELFDELGFEETTIRKIALQAGVGTGTVFLYAENKVALAYQLFEEILLLAIQQGQKVEADSLLDQLVEIFGAFYDMYAERPQLARELVKNTLFMSGPAAASYLQLNANFVESLAQRLVPYREHLGTSTPELAAAHLFPIYLWNTFLFLQTNPLDPQRGRQQLREAFQSYLQAIGGNAH